VTDSMTINRKSCMTENKHAARETPSPLNIENPHGNDAAIRTTIEAVVAAAFGVSIRALESATRGSPPVAFARQIAMYLAHVGCGLSLTAVGRHFARDRTTVAHACSLIEDRREDHTLDRTLDLLESVVVHIMGKHGHYVGAGNTSPGGRIA
jgi:chromosomal replication initiation ATPase DnaA